MEKLQNALINKALEGSSGNNTNKDLSMTRRTTSPFADRTQDYLNNNSNMNLSTAALS